jgi:hypothetical protein
VTHVVTRLTLVVQSVMHVVTCTRLTLVVQSVMHVVTRLTLVVQSVMHVVTRLTLVVQSVMHVVTRLTSIIHSVTYLVNSIFRLTSVVQGYPSDSEADPVVRCVKNKAFISSCYTINICTEEEKIFKSCNLWVLNESKIVELVGGGVLK